MSTKNNSTGGSLVTDTEQYINNVVNNIDRKKLRPKSKADMMCAPGLSHDAGSCARLTVLIELANAYNKSAQVSDHIRLSSNHEVLNPQKYKMYLVHEIGDRIGDKCKNQKCWSQQEFMRYMEDRASDEFVKYTFRPESPQGKWEWLSTFNINDAMAQYEKKYNGFKFFGAVPMDFADLSNLEISHVNYQKLMNNGITKLGVVFNLDDHNEPGSHWVAMYTDLAKGKVLYFDSFGIRPEQRVRALMREQVRFMEKHGKSVDSLKVDYNRTQHQKGNSECGVYSMNFLIRMARGDNFDKLCSNPVSDKKMNKCRAIYFDKHSNKKR